MTTLSTEDNPRQSADDRDPDGLNSVIEVMGNPGNASSHRVHGALSDARGIKEFFSRLG
jgi:hypothetical protein